MIFFPFKTKVIVLIEQQMDRSLCSSSFYQIHSKCTRELTQGRNLGCSIFSSGAVYLEDFSLNLIVLACSKQFEQL